VHLVVRKGSGIKTVRDLRGKRVSLDETGSGTLVDARLILAAYGLSERDFKPQYIPAQHVADSFKDGTIDAFFNMSGWPQSSIVDLAGAVGIDLVPIEGPEIERLLKQYPFFGADEIPDEAYRGVSGVRTISAHALWLTSAKQPAPLIYQVTAALWNNNTRKLLDSGHVKGQVIRLQSALTGVGIPLHDGAEKFYKEQDLIK
jgi:TRAP transporter TAXI family solute receptor